MTFFPPFLSSQKEMGRRCGLRKPASRGLEAIHASKRNMARGFRGWRPLTRPGARGWAGPNRKGLKVAEHFQKEKTYSGVSRCKFWARGLFCNFYFANTGVLAVGRTHPDAYTAWRQGLQQAVTIDTRQLFTAGGNLPLQFRDFCPCWGNLHL